MRDLNSIISSNRSKSVRAFTITDLLVTLAVLSLIATTSIAMVVRGGEKPKIAQCLSNLQQVNRAVIQFADEHAHTLPGVQGSPEPGGQWWYKELVKGYLGLPGESSANDRVFACPNDRGYGDGLWKIQPFCTSKRHDFTSYVYNGVDLPGVPNIAGREIASIRAPNRTLLTMEWPAHAPLSWHRSRTGQANTPFYNDAESTVGFVDGHVALIKIYYDGMNAAYTRDPIAGYDYKYSGD
jgi:prepilin-type processing-associated H-X9-DG protein